MDFKIVFSDIDGTILNSEHRMLKGTLDAIFALKKANIPFTVYQLKLILVYPVLLFQPCLHKGIAVLIKKLGSDAACHKFTP